MRRLLSAATAVAVFGAAAPPALAQAIGPGCSAYFPIRAEGAACSRPEATAHVTVGGRTACCLPQARTPGVRQPGTVYVPSHGNRIAAGLAIAGVALQIIQELVNIFDSASSSSDENVRPDPDSPDVRIEGEKAEMMKKVAALHADGLRLAKAGDHRSAQSNFKRAALIAGQIGQSGPYWRDYWANNALMNLKEALALRAEAKFADAHYYLAVARGDAAAAGRADLARQIIDYQTTVRDEWRKYRRAGGADKDRKYRTETECTLFNGTRICQ